jgi:cyclopropane fatty-acyl-phospholipid synthase-like methyltransferase
MINTISKEDFYPEQFPISSKYDPEWLIKNNMGPCSIWLTEFLMENMKLEPGMRVLDMGCGMGMSSVFLAKEYGVTVFANDLWISPSDNYKRFIEMDVSDCVFPIQADAHSLPYAENFFDAVVSIDSYHYFGTNDLFLLDFIKYIKPGGKIGVVSPGLTHEIGNDVPESIRDYWDEGFCSFHSPSWWKEHFEKCKSVSVDIADSLTNRREIWLKWEIINKQYKDSKDDRYINLLEIDQGKTLTFSRIVATKKASRVKLK